MVHAMLGHSKVLDEGDIHVCFSVDKAVYNVLKAQMLTVKVTTNRSNTGGVPEVSVPSMTQHRHSLHEKGVGHRHFLVDGRIK